MNSYPPGTRRIWTQFRIRKTDQSPGALTNPAVVTFTTTDPNGVETTKVYPDTVVRATTGIYYLDFTADVVGVWRYRMNGDGSAVEGEFRVNASVFVP